MLVKEVLIKLENEERYPKMPSSYPKITHAKIVSINIEIPRPSESKHGEYNIWIAKGFFPKESTIKYMHEAIGLEGINFQISEPELFTVLEKQGSRGDTLTEFLKILTEHLIDSDRIKGTVEINEYEI